ncbi:MAG: hypothetical protein E7Y34_02295, partial [Mycoplasma sp.]|nr:hypothetical protein [Mycoplasma sp.]
MLILISLVSLSYLYTKKLSTIFYVFNYATFKKLNTINWPNSLKNIKTKSTLSLVKLDIVVSWLVLFLGHIIGIFYKPMFDGIDSYRLAI